MADPHPNQPRRRPAPIEHTCEPGSDRQRCACTRARQAAQQRERRRTQDRYAKHVQGGNLRRLYGIGVEEYEAMREAQGRRCAICGTHEDDIKQQNTGRPRADGSPTALARKLVVDHCHVGGGIRALLCQRCNMTLARVADDAELLRASADYLDKWRPES